MANKLSKEKAKAIATEYVENGYQKVLALLTIGYKPSYAKTLGLKIYDNIEVCKAVKAIQANKQVKSIYSRLLAEQEYEQAFQVALRKSDASAMISATTGKAKLYGLPITTNVNLDADLGRRPPDTKDAIERSKKWVDNISTDNKET